MKKDELEQEVASQKMHIVFLWLVVGFTFFLLNWPVRWCVDDMKERINVLEHRESTP